MFFSWESSKSRHIRIPVVIFDPGRDEQSEYELGTMPMFLPSELLLDTTCAGTCLHCVCVYRKHWCAVREVWVNFCI